MKLLYGGEVNTSLGMSIPVPSEANNIYNNPVLPGPPPRTITDKTTNEMKWLDDDRKWIPLTKGTVTNDKFWKWDGTKWNLNPVDLGPQNRGMYMPGDEERGGRKRTNRRRKNKRHTLRKKRKSSRRRKYLQ
jgi:hypothetical protein